MVCLTTKIRQSLEAGGLHIIGSAAGHAHAAAIFTLHTAIAVQLPDCFAKDHYEITPIRWPLLPSVAVMHDQGCPGPGLCLSTYLVSQA